MKVARTIVVLAAYSVAALAQSKSKTPGEQRYFNLVNIVQRPVQLSDVELAALANDDLMRKFSPASAGSKLTQEGLEATVVSLCGADERDLIVIGNGGSYATTYTGPFWIIREPATGPVVALSESSLSLSLDTKRSNKCLTVEAFAVTATDGITTQYKFNGQQYAPSKQTSVKLP